MTKYRRYNPFVPVEKLTRARIIEALNLLGKLAAGENLTLELCIYGGSAMVLATVHATRPKMSASSQNRAKRLMVSPEWSLNDYSYTQIG